MPSSKPFEVKEHSKDSSSKKERWHLIEALESLKSVDEQNHNGVGLELLNALITNHGGLLGSNLTGIEFKFNEMPVGGAAIDIAGVPLPDETLAACKQSDAVLLAAIGGYKWDNNEPHLRPERGLLGLRAGLGVFANLRPAIVLPQDYRRTSLVGRFMHALVEFLETPSDEFLKDWKLKKIHVHWNYQEESYSLLGFDCKGEILGLLLWTSYPKYEGA
eukprot:Gb_03044 [translate_table: standard]